MEKEGGLLSDSEKTEAENKEGDVDDSKVHIVVNPCNYSLFSFLHLKCICLMFNLYSIFQVYFWVNEVDV